MLLLKYIKRFFLADSTPGILLILSSIAALWVSNSHLYVYYKEFLHVNIGFGFNAIKLVKPLQLWINDGLMAVFFLLIGLEIKRELLEGNLANAQRMVLPVIGALGGIFVPAAIFFGLNHNNEIAIRGWAIPTATDVAFALGLLVLLGPQAPRPLRVLLTAVAIFDDLFAIGIIAVFYTTTLSYLPLFLAFVCFCVMVVVNKRNVATVWPYLCIGAIMWVCILLSGIHATLAGVIAALTIPLNVPNIKHSPLKYLEDKLYPWSAYCILPLFAFSNVGIPLSNISLAQLFNMVPLGIAFGLFFGKQIGVFFAIFFSVKLKFAQLPLYLSWRHIYGMSVMCGIGFTMSLFIGALAYSGDYNKYAIVHRIGILVGSLLSAVWGYIFFYFFVSKKYMKIFPQD